MPDICRDEQCHFFEQIQGTLTKPFRFLYTDNHSTAIPQFSLYEGANNFYVLEGSFFTGLIISNPHVEIDRFTAVDGMLYIDAQFTYTNKSITSLSQPGFDIRLFGSSFDQSLKDIESNEIDINDLKTRVSNIPTTQKASQSEVNDGTNNDKFITPDTFHNSDIINSIIDDDLYQKYEADIIASNNQNGNVIWRQPQDFSDGLSGSYPCSKVVEIPLSITSTEISIYPNQDELGNLRSDRPWMEDRMICMLFQMIVKKGNLLHYPTNVHFSNIGLNTNFTPKVRSTRYDDYFFYINKHKLNSNPTNELMEIKFSGMQTQNNVSIFCNFQFAVLPLTVSDFTKEIYDVRFYNKIIKAQQIKINKLETELSTIKLSFDTVYFYGKMIHNNASTAKFSWLSQVKFSGTDFEFTPSDSYERLWFKKSGIYNISFIDGIKTSSSTYLNIKFFNTGLDIIDKNSTIQFRIEDTQSLWMKICESITVPVTKDAELQIELAGAILDGMTNSSIMIKSGFPNDII